MTILDNFHQLMSSCVSETMIWANGNGPRPKQAFCTLEITPSTPLPVHRGHVDEQGLRLTQASRIVEVQVQFFGDEALSRADSFSMRLWTEGAQDLSEALDIGILSVDRIQQLPSLRDDAQYEDRAIVDLTCHYLGSVEEFVSYIETVEASAQVNELPPTPFTVHVE